MGTFANRSLLGTPPFRGPGGNPTTQKFLLYRVDSIIQPYFLQFLPDDKLTRLKIKQKTNKKYFKKIKIQK